MQAYTVTARFCLIDLLAHHYVIKIAHSSI